MNVTMVARSVCVEHKHSVCLFGNVSSERTKRISNELVHSCAHRCKVQSMSDNLNHIRLKFDINSTAGSTSFRYGELLQSPFYWLEGSKFWLDFSIGALLRRHTTATNSIWILRHRTFSMSVFCLDQRRKFRKHWKLTLRFDCLQKAI